MKGLRVHMKTVGLRERKKIRRREEIIRSAVWLFTDKGYDETTIADIAEMAEVAPRTVLTYFATKEDIAMAPVVEIARGLVAAIRARRDQEPILDIFAAWMRDELLASGATPSNLDLLRKMFERNPRLNALQSASTAAALAEVTQIIAKDMGRPQDDVAPAIVVGAMVGILTQVFGNPLIADQRDAVDLAIRFLKAGVAEMCAKADED
jgi:AcrR family transcriptional regulator